MNIRISLISPFYPSQIMVLSAGAASCQPVRPSTRDAVGELHTLVGLFAFWPRMAWNVEKYAWVCLGIQ